MSPRIDRPRVRIHRLDILIPWFAASLMVTAGIIYGLKVQDDRRRKPPPPGLAPCATRAQEPLTLQQIRAGERGRGRGARAPLQIPWRGWKDVFVRTYREILDDRLLALAAGIAFYSLVALFPAIAAGGLSLARFAQLATLRQHPAHARGLAQA